VRLLIVPLTVLSLLPAAHGADRETPRHKLRLGISLAAVSGDYTAETTEESIFARQTATTIVDGGSSLGLRIGYEYRPLRLLGVALEAESITVDMGFTEMFVIETFDFFTEEVIRVDNASGATDGELRMSPVTLGLHVYLTSGKRHDVYVGPVAGYVFYDKLVEDAWIAPFEDDTVPDLNGAGTSIELDDDTALGAVAGVDLNLRNGKASFYLAVGYLDASVDAKDAESDFTMDVDPIMMRAGAVFRF
jgi:hypothetical protein